MNRAAAASCLFLAFVVAPSRARAEDTAHDAAAPAAKATAEPTVLLHVDSPQVVAIERADDGELVCTSPCDARVPATARYRIAGSRPSSPFVLDARRERADVAIDPASKRGFVVGVAALGTGAALAIAGGLTLGLATASREEIPADGATTNAGFTDAMTAGTVMILSGIAIGLWGGGTTLANAKTKVSGDVVADPPARGLAPTPIHRAAVTPSPALMIPILGGTF